MEWAEILSIGALVAVLAIGWRIGRFEKDWERDMRELRQAITRLTERITESGIKR